MANRFTRLSLLLIVLSSCYAGASMAGVPSSGFSHKGLKLGFGLGVLDLAIEPDLKAGQTAFVSLGYGLSQRSTLWLSLVGAEHNAQPNGTPLTELDAVEFSFQHKVRSRHRLQPYGKIGLGGYWLQQRGSAEAIYGGGLTLALGVDYFLTRHWGVGLELGFKDVEYSGKKVDEDGGSFFKDLSRPVNGDVRAIMITVVLQ